MPDLLPLDDGGALDRGAVGAKAAWLALGRRHGLPVLPGVVVPASESRAVLARSAAILERRGSGGARLAAATAELPEDLLDRLSSAVVGLGSPLVVRSSTLLDDKGEWAGAFASYRNVGAAELATAIKGCWASVFSPHVLARFTAARVAPAMVVMAVLIQPELRADVGGTAHIVGDEAQVILGSVPEHIVQGHDPGVAARLRRAGAADGDEARELLGEPSLHALTGVLFDAHDRTGATSFEWLGADGNIVLAQLDRHQVPARPPQLQRITISDQVVSAGRLLRRFPGPVGLQLVVRWAVTCPDIVGVPNLSTNVADPAAAWQEALAIAARLTAAVWGSDAPADRADAILELLELDPARAMVAAAERPRPEVSSAQRLLGLVSSVEARLLAAGRIARPGDIWRLDVEDVSRLLHSGAEPGPGRFGVDRWEPLTSALVTLTGATLNGVAASPGFGSGRMCFVDDPTDTRHVRSRDVIVAAWPLPHLAPLLWDAAGLVTIGGGPGAHLFESARSLGLPAVAGCRLDPMPAQLRSAQSVVVVDGTAGRVAISPW